ncbi:hypothetical protein [Rothia sp. 11254D007BW]
MSFGVGDESFVFTPSGRSVRKLTVERVEDAMLDRGFAGLGVFLPDGGNIGGVSDLVVEDTVVAVQGELEYYTLVPAYGDMYWVQSTPSTHTPPEGIIKPCPTNTPKNSKNERYDSSVTD